MSNPFDDIAARLARIEALLEEAKNTPAPTPPPAPTEDDLLTKRQAAALLRCSTSTIGNFARAGKLQRFYLGRVVRFKRGEVLNLIGRKS